MESCDEVEHQYNFFIEKRKSEVEIKTNDNENLHLFI